MNYIVIQDSRKNKGSCLALVDRQKKTNGFWTSVLENALVFNDKLKADSVASKLKFNNPRVVPIEIASDIIKPIITVTYTLQEVKRTKSIFEMNMYEYKEWLGYSDAIECGGSSGEI